MSRSVINLVTELLAGVEESAKQFRFYETSHRMKGTPESDEKAQVNADLAYKLEQTAYRARGIEE